jgi:hypothetical protein
MTPFNKLPQYNIMGMEIGRDPNNALVEFASMSQGGNGFLIGTAASAVSGTNKEFYSFTVLADAVISAITWAAYYRGDSDIVGITLPAGTTIFAGFSSMSLTSGTVIAYFSINTAAVSKSSAGEDYYTRPNL